MPRNRCRGTALHQSFAQPVYGLELFLEIATAQGSNTRRGRAQAAQPLRLVRRDQLSRTGWRRCPDVGDEVRDREVDFVADRFERTKNFMAWQAAALKIPF